jgi:integrase
MGGPYGGIVALLALTGQRREEVAQMRWDELCPAWRTWTIPGGRAKNGRPHVVHLSDPARAVLEGRPRLGPFVFAVGGRPIQSFSQAKRELDEVSGVKTWRLHDLRRTAVSGMARLGVAPHVADKILNHASGAISGVAAAYQRHEFMAERKEALERWGEHVAALRAISASPAPDVAELEVRPLVQSGDQAEAATLRITPEAA